MRILGIVLIIAWTASAHAGGQTSAGKIELLYLHGGWTMVRVPEMNNPQSNPDGCDSTLYFAINPSDANYEAKHATLLSAQVAQMTVRFYVVGCGGQNSAYPKITSIFLHSN